VLVHELGISTRQVLWIEAVIPDRRQGLIRQGRLIFDDTLIVTPPEHGVVHSAARGGVTVFGTVTRVVVVRVTLKGVRVDDTFFEGTAYWEGGSHDVPLALSVDENKKLSGIVDQACKLEPPGFAIAVNGLYGLQEMLDLSERSIGIRSIDECIELLHRLSESHFCSCLGLGVITGLEIVGNSSAPRAVLGRNL
jgi:hypothetical protein